MLLIGNLAQVGWFLNGYAAEQMRKGRYEWAFWDATRIVPGTINEFPFFTFLFADLHAHMLVMPLSLAALGLALAWMRQGTVRHWWIIGWLGLVAGAIRATNTWDYPTFVGLAGIMLALASGRHWRRAGWGWPATGLAAIVVGVAPALIGNLLFAPFIANFVTESSGIAFWQGPGFSLLEAIINAERTTAGQLFTISGHWVVLWLLGIGLWAWRRRETLLIVIGPLAFWVLALIFDLVAVLPLLVMLVITAWVLWRIRNQAIRFVVPVLWTLAGIGLWAMVEVVVVRGDVGRMNTVFKFGLHSWMLLALAAAAAMPWGWAATRLLAPRWCWLLRAIGGLVLAAGLVYPLTAIPARIADRWNPDAPRTLDGAAFLSSINAAQHGPAYSLDEDAAAIDWLRRNARGTPIILEAHQPSYQWASRIATFTGLPTLLGWEWHQIQQRSAVNATPVINYRQQIIATIYNTPDPDIALAALGRYGVEYVYVGGVERQLYSAEGLAKFQTLVERGALERVFQTGESVLYRVRTPGQPQMLTNDLPIRPPTMRTTPALELTQPVQQLPAVGHLGRNTVLSEQQWLALIAWLGIWYLIAGLGILPAYAALGHHGLVWARPIGLIMLGLRHLATDQS
jgi:Chlor_Arch_YYY domain